MKQRQRSTTKNQAKIWECLVFYSSLQQFSKYLFCRWRNWDTQSFDDVDSRLQELGSNPCLSVPDIWAHNNLESSVNFLLRFIWGSFLCQRHNVPAISLLKTAISGSKTLIFQIGRLTVSGGISLGHAILHHCQGGAWAKRAVSRLASQKIKKEKRGFPWQKNSLFSVFHWGLDPFPVTSHSTPFGNQPSFCVIGPVKNLSEDFGWGRLAMFRFFAIINLLFTIIQRTHYYKENFLLKKNIVHKELERRPSEWLLLLSRAKFSSQQPLWEVHNCL